MFMYSESSVSKPEHSNLNTEEKKKQTVKNTTTIPPSPPPPALASTRKHLEISERVLNSDGYPYRKDRWE